MQTNPQSDPGSYSLPDGALVQVGCGDTPLAGWVNFDNSPSVRLAGLPPPLSRGLEWVGDRLRLLTPPNRVLIDRARQAGIQWANAQSLPLAARSVALLYSAHMLEHVEEAVTGGATEILKEFHRVIMPGGCLRLVVPDLNQLARNYVAGTVSADRFLEQLHLSDPNPPRNWHTRLRALATGPRQHQHAYDSDSLSQRLTEIGFDPVITVPAGQTSLVQTHGIDLWHRSDESLYVEAWRP